MSRTTLTYGKTLMNGVELALSAVVAAALCYTVQGGFNISESLHEAVWLDVLVSFVLQGMLLWGVFNPKRRIASVVAYVVVSLGACAAAIALAPEGNPIADVPQNPFVAVALFVVVNLVVFALARRRVSCVVLFGLGAFVCGLTQFLYVMNMLVATAVFLITCCMLIAFRSYDETVRMASASSFPLLGKAGFVGTLIPVAACLIASVIVIGVIMPLNPPHASIKLFDEYLAYEEDHVKTSVVLDEDAEKTMTTSIVDDNLEPRTTTDMRFDATEPQKAESTPPPPEEKDYLSEDYSDVDLSGLFQNAKAFALDPPVPWRIIILCIVAAIVALLTLPRYIAHRIRLRRIASKQPRGQISELYSFFLGRFKKLGMEKPESLSPVEYANLFRRRLAPFVGAQEAGSFDHLTSLLVQQEYAGSEPDAEDLQWMYRLYWTFYKRCRKELGLFNYCFKRLTL